MADQPSILVKALTAGVSGCIADFATFPLDTAKVRLQIQGEGSAAAVLTADGTAAFAAAEARYCGLLGTVATIARQEGPKALYNGLSAGLQRQMCFASVRLGLYDSVKSMYQSLFEENPSSIGGAAVKTRIAAGLTTGALAVCVAQPTDVVKVRFQAQTSGKKYASTYQAYRHIASKNGVAGLWRGVLPNISRNAIINVAEIVCYDVVKDTIIAHSILEDGIPCHFASAVVAGLCATVVASPVDVVKTRYMNSSHGEYRGALDCAVRMAANEGPQAFYKGFAPSFCRLVSWNICMWITYEQMKKVVQQHI